MTLLPPSSPTHQSNTLLCHNHLIYCPFLGHYSVKKFSVYKWSKLVKLHCTNHEMFIFFAFFQPDWSLMDFSPLLSVYCIVFLYISFSVGKSRDPMARDIKDANADLMHTCCYIFLHNFIDKIDLVKSKIGLGFTVCITVIAALTMSLGICTFFGLSISLIGR